MYCVSVLCSVKNTAGCCGSSMGQAPPVEEISFSFKVFLSLSLAAKQRNFGKSLEPLKYAFYVTNNGYSH